MLSRPQFERFGRLEICSATLQIMFCRLEVCLIGHSPPAKCALVKCPVFATGWIGPSTAERSKLFRFPTASFVAHRRACRSAVLFLYQDESMTVDISSADSSGR